MARPASAADLPAIADIYAHYVMASVATFEVEPPGVDEWACRFAAIVDAGLPFLVAERKGAVAAYAYCGPWKSRPAYRATVENSIYVSPRLLGCGCGSELMAALLEGAHAVGMREVIAVIADSGDPSSVALHRRFGFAEVGRLTRVGFKHDRWIDTVLMQRSLVTEDPAGPRPVPAQDGADQLDRAVRVLGEPAVDAGPVVDRGVDVT